MGTGTLTFQGTLVIEECCSCGVAFAWPKDLEKYKLDHRLDNNRKWFYCPNGHPQYFTGRPEADRLREQLQVERDNAEFWRGRTKATERQLSATKGVVTRTKRRISNGVCPCCKRTFANVRRHMESEHPDYTKQEV